MKYEGWIQEVQGRELSMHIAGVGVGVASQGLRGSSCRKPEQRGRLVAWLEAFISW